jgi:hypothetical protein
MLCNGTEVADTTYAYISVNEKTVPPRKRKYLQINTSDLEEKLEIESPETIKGRSEERRRREQFIECFFRNKRFFEKTVIYDAWLLAYAVSILI